MDGLNNATGASNILDVKDGPMKGVWIMGALTAKDYGFIEQHLISLRKDPIDAVLPQIEKLIKAGQHAMAKRLERMAFRDCRKTPQSDGIPQSDVSEWVDTVDGQAFTYWILLRKNHPDMTLEKVYAIIDAISQQSQEELKKKLLAAAGAGPGGNEDGPASKGAAGPNLEDGASLSTGDKSSGS